MAVSRDDGYGGADIARTVNYTPLCFVIPICPITAVVDSLAINKTARKLPMSRSWLKQVLREDSGWPSKLGKPKLEGVVGMSTT